MVIRVERRKHMIKVLNLPKNLAKGWMVARSVDGELWYYGCYETMEQATSVANMINGVVIESKGE